MQYGSESTEMTEQCEELIQCARSVKSSPSADGRTVAVVSEEVESDRPRLMQPADLSVSKQNMAAAQVL